MSLRYEVATPEGVTFHFALAGPGPRAAAWAIDTVIQFFVGFVLILLGSLIAGFSGGFLSFLIPIILFVVVWGYHVWFEVRKAGISPGKKFLKLRVLSDDGLPVGVYQSILRNLLRVFDGLPGGIGAYLIAERGFGYAALGFLSGYMAAIIVMYFGSHQRRIGDLAGGTIVVRTEEAQVPPEVPPAERRANPLRRRPGTAERLCRQLSMKEQKILKDLCLRRDELDLEPRMELFGRAAEHFRIRFPFLREWDIGDEKLILYMMDAIS